MDEPADMTTVEGLTLGLRQTREHGNFAHVLVGTPDGTYCPKCGDARRMQVDPLHRPPTVTRVTQSPARDRTDMTDPENLPSVFRLRCVQCSETIIVVAYQGPDGPDVAALSSTYGGLSTPHAPPTVAYYLDQAERSYGMGAHSAAMTMYRSALEQVLMEQGYKARMLGPKIGELENDPDPPKWYRDLHPDFLDVIRKLGNMSTHADEGDVRVKADRDREFVPEVRALFVELMEDVYEQPARQAARLAKMKRATGGQ